MSDLISRQAARNALLNKGQHSKRYKLGETWELNLMEIEETLLELPSVEPKKCGDYVSRKATLDEFKRIYFDNATVVRCAELVLGKMPSVEPERKMGKWIEHKWAEEENGLLISNWECSLCGMWERKTSDFCPNCGAKMEAKNVRQKETSTTN